MLIYVKIIKKKKFFTRSTHKTIVRNLTKKNFQFVGKKIPTNVLAQPRLLTIQNFTLIYFQSFSNFRFQNNGKVFSFFVEKEPIVVIEREPTSKDLVVQIPLLRMTDEGVLELGLAHPNRIRRLVAHIQRATLQINRLLEHLMDGQTLRTIRRQQRQRVFDLVHALLLVLFALQIIQNSSELFQIISVNLKLFQIISNYFKLFQVTSNYFKSFQIIQNNLVQHVSALPHMVCFAFF